MVKEIRERPKNIDVYSQRTKVMIPVLVAILSIGGLTSYYYIQNQADAENMGLGEFGNSLSLSYPKAIVVNEKINQVNDVILTKISDTSVATTIERDEMGFSNTKEILNKASIELHHGTTSDKKDVVMATVINTGNQLIYVKNFIITGESSTGAKVVESYVIDADYDELTFGNIPKPSEIDYVALKPGESVSGHITGKWNIASMPIEHFSAGAVLVMDPSIVEYSPGNYLSINIGPIEV